MTRAGSFREPTMEEYLIAVARGMDEKVLVSRIIEHAGRAGWRAMHQLPSANLRGQYRTAVQGHKGFPDIVLAGPGPGQLMFVECKSHTGKLEPEQVRWRDMLMATGADWRLWRPMDWLSGRIEKAIERAD